MKNTLRMFIASLVISSSYGAIAQPNVRTQQSTQERIYGSDMMSQNERQNYMNQLQNAKTEQEREQIRNQHRIEMDARMNERNQIQDGGARGPAGGRGK